MTDPDIEQTFADLAALSPDPAATRQSIARVQSLLAAAPTPRRARVRWLWPVSFAAALLLAALITIPFFQTHASAAEELATTLKAGAGYKGWVHMSFEKNTAGATSIVVHGNTVTGASAIFEQWPERPPYPFALRSELATVGPDGKRTTQSFNLSTDNGSPARTTITYENPATGQSADYNSSAGLIRLGRLSPDRSVLLLKNAAAAGPLINYQDLSDTLTRLLGENAVYVFQSDDRGMKRFTLSLRGKLPETVGKNSVNTFEKNLPFQVAPSFSIAEPFSIWVDPESRMIRELSQNDVTYTFTYGAPDISSIYDAGAPRDARIYDSRPTPEIAAVFSRAAKRMPHSFPDGVYVALTQVQGDDDAETVLAFSKTGTQWCDRTYYAVTHPGTPRDHYFLLPNDWPNAGAEELFRNFATTMPQTEWSGEVGTARLKEFDELGRVYKNPQYPAGVQESDLAAGENTPGGLFPYVEAFENCYNLNTRLDLTTSPDHPNLVGLRIQYHSPASADDTSSFSEDWIDPAHADRLVTSTNSHISKDANGNPMPFHSVTEYTDYGTFPAPDSHLYPTAWTTINTSGTPASPQAHKTTIMTTLHYFPNRTLPPLPLIPQ